VGREGETDDVGVVKVDLCPGAGFVSLSFFLHDLEDDVTGWMDEPGDVVAGSERDYRDWKRHLDDGIVACWTVPRRASRLEEHVWSCLA